MNNKNLINEVLKYNLQITTETQMRFLTAFEMIRGIGLENIKNSVWYKESNELKGFIEFYEKREKQIKELLDKHSDYSMKLLLANTFRIEHLFVALSEQEKDPNMKINCIPDVHPDFHPIDNLFSYKDTTSSPVKIPESVHLDEVKKMTGLMNALAKTIDKYKSNESENDEKQQENA